MLGKLVEYFVALLINLYILATLIIWVPIIGVYIFNLF